MIILNNKFDFGDIVYVLSDPDQFRRMVTGITVRQGGVLVYELTCGAATSHHFEYELSEQKTLAAVVC